MSPPRDRYESDDELCLTDATFSMERLSEDGIHVSATGRDGTTYWMKLHSETPITWDTEVHEPEWCRMDRVRGPGCWRCRGEWWTTQEGFPPSVFIVCPVCGNKRCPKAAWHGYKCTGSNEPNQKGQSE